MVYPPLDGHPSKYYRAWRRVTSLLCLSTLPLR